VNERTDIDNSLILSSVRALWGMVPPTLRSVSVELRDDKIVWQCLFDENASEDDFGLLSSAAAEIIADYNVYGLEEVLKKVPLSDKLENLKNVVYYRHEHSYYKV
jgi:hypothetical protein